MKRKQQTLSFPVKGKKEPEKDRTDFKNPEIHILSWNVNGVRAWASKAGTLDFINRPEIDIVCFNETKIQNIHIDQMRLMFPAYRYQYWSCSEVKKGYSGTAVLSKVKPITVSYGLEGHEKEGRVIIAEFEEFYLVASYIPSSMSRFKYRVNHWDLDFRKLLLSLKQKKNLVWIGDLNVINLDIDVYSLEGNQNCAGGTKEERASFHLTLQNGFCDSFRELHPTDRKYSWFNVKRKTAKERNQGWRFDMAVVDEDFISRVKDSLIYDQVNGSDHYPIELVLNS